MTTEQLKQTAAAMLAFTEGNPVQVANTLQPNEWKDTPNPLWNLKDGYFYRPKPEPKTRPWSKPSDVPGPVCWIRYAPHRRGFGESMIVGVDKFGVDNMDGDSMRHESWNELEGQEYSTDRINWKPCEVTEE